MLCVTHEVSTFQFKPPFLEKCLKKFLIVKLHRSSTLDIHINIILCFEFFLHAVTKFHQIITLTAVKTLKLDKRTLTV